MSVGGKQVRPDRPGGSKQPLMAVRVPEHDGENGSVQALALLTRNLCRRGLLLLAPVLASAHLPVEGLGILLAVDLIPDTFKTIANVTGDMAVATILSRRPSRHVPELPHAITAGVADNPPS